MKRSLKLKLAALAAAVASALAAPAHALVGGAANNGSLFVSVWDTSSGGSYSFVQDLGYQINSFLPSGVTDPSPTNLNGGPFTGDKTPNAGLHLDFNVSSFLSSYTGSLSTLAWRVFAADSTASSPTTNERRLVTTVTQGTTSSSPLTNSGLTIVTTNVGNSGAFYNGAGCAAGSVAGSNCTSTDTSSASWAGNVSTLNISSFGAIGDVLNMLYVAQNGTNPGSGTLQPSSQLFSNANGLASWTLSSAGQLSYDVPAGVPLPAAAWLFGSGLLGIVGISRRRKLAVA
jgi:hypothetical protein